MEKLSADGPFYITTPIFYPNANPHMGHAYTTTIADIFARYGRLTGKDVYFLTGVDENSEKVVRAAKSAGQTTVKYLDETVSNFKNLFSADKLNISYDQFIRTSDEKVHWPGAEELWRRIAAAGDLEKRSYEGLYCVGHEAFITEKDLVNGKCPDHDEVPQRLKEENYFFLLSRYTDKIKEKIKSNELRIVPDSRRNEILALLERGLEDVSFSRPAGKVSVGVPVPSDPSQKMYVWCDALSNYITALGFGRKDDGLYKKFWPADLQIIGKDILRFHAAIWPGMLLSAGLPLPKTILVHGFLTSGGVKMSKTLGNIIDPNELITEYGGEAVRYYLARHIHPFEDGDITREKFKEIYNANLANGLGNLVSRVMKMAATNNIRNDEKTYLAFSKTKEAENLYKKQTEGFEKHDLMQTADAVWELISETDRIIQERQPFKKIKTDKEGGEQDIRELLARVSMVGTMLAPILPQTSAEILSLVKQNKMPEKPLFPRKG